MTWNSKQIRACITRVRAGGMAGLDEASGAPFDVAVAYGAWDGTPADAAPPSGPAVGLVTSLGMWCMRVGAEEINAGLRRDEKLAGTPAPLPNGATVTRHMVTELKRGDGSLLARHDGSAPDDVLIVFGEKGHALTVQIETLDEVVMMAHRARAACPAGPSAATGQPQ